LLQKSQLTQAELKNFQILTTSKISESKKVAKYFRKTFGSLQTKRLPLHPLLKTTTLFFITTNLLAKIFLQINLEVRKKAVPLQSDFF
jgi:hypothetical protein